MDAKEEKAKPGPTLRHYYGFDIDEEIASASKRRFLRAMARTLDGVPVGSGEMISIFTGLADALLIFGDMFSAAPEHRKAYTEFLRQVEQQMRGSLETPPEGTPTQ